MFGEETIVQELESNKKVPPSRPLPLTEPKGKNGRRHRDFNFPLVPPCPCGSERLFEFQVMPAVLHTLDVDRYKVSKHGSDSDNKGTIEMVMDKEEGGMNWGAIAVYSCAASCELSREEFVVVQESGDGVPKRKTMTLIESDNCSNDGAHKD
jgi:hypothetical protein